MDDKAAWEELWGFERVDVGEDFDDDDDVHDGCLFPVVWEIDTT